jgi:hypothetical protein
MPDQTTQLPWTQPGWFAQASTWIAAELDRLGIGVSGPIAQPHVRPWSTVLRVPTRTGDLYFKATAPLLAHEPVLTQALARWRPDCMLPILAADLERGWMLLPDGGTRLREIVRADQDLRHWEALLPIYAEMQIDLAGRVPELLALGAPDRRLAVLPARYEQLLADTDALRVDLPGGLTRAQTQRLHELAPRCAALCERLAGYRVPDSLHHGDFHDGNIFVRDGRYRFFDWGDSCAAHPFFSLRTAFVSVEMSLGLDEGSDGFERLRDAYLEPWTRDESPTNLRAAFRLALPLAAVCGALAWQRAVSSLAEPFKEQYAEPVPSLLQEFLSAEITTDG